MIGIDAELLIDHAWGYEPCTIKKSKAINQVQTASLPDKLQHPYDFSQTRIAVQEMTDLLVLDLVEKDLVTDSLRIHRHDK